MPLYAGRIQDLDHRTSASAALDPENGHDVGGTSANVNVASNAGTCVVGN
ncbi:MAG: hypothetical protein ABIP55_17005 [Tepidisphaeraceae bacterium]